MAGSIIYKNLAYPITYFAASSGDSDSLNSYMKVNAAYKSTLDNMNVGFFNGNTTWHGVKYNADSSVLKGIWGGRPWITPGFTTSGSNKFAHVGTAPLYDTNCNMYQSNVRNRSTSTCYMCVTYYNNKLYWAKPTSATVPTSWTEVSFGNYANVVLISMCGGGGGGGGGASALSQGTSLQVGEIATIGLGGQGGVAQCYDTSGEWSGAGTNGYSGIVEVLFEGAYKTLAEIDASV